jgi:hypothetical protein
MDKRELLYYQLAPQINHAIMLFEELQNSLTKAQKREVKKYSKR